MKPETVLIVCLSVFAVVLAIVEANNAHELSKLQRQIDDLELQNGNDVDEGRVEEIVEEMVKDRCLE